ncbi:MAG: hypothetical protein GY795_11150 [Desulfobacterales bacterium]|nr:hypothetical protein [Desulfobacterales bacterium]
MGVEYTICLSHPNMFHYLVDNYLSKKILSADELLELFTDLGKVIPDYLQGYFSGSSSSLRDETYDEFIYELISDKTVELYKAGFLDKMASIHRGISNICVYFGDTFLRRKSRMELKVPQLKGVSCDFNLCIYDVSGLKDEVELISDLKEKEIVLKLLDNVLKVLKNKSYSFFERLAKSEKLDIKKYSEFKKEQSEYHWEIWATYLDTLIFAIENNMYFGVYYYC